MSLKALLIFGQKFGTDNPALIALGNKIKAIGVDVTYAHWDDKTFPDDYDILVGHSYGGQEAWMLSNMKAPKYLALIDIVSEGWFPFFIWNFWKKFEISSNVLKCDCFQRSFPLLPPSGTIGNPSLSYVNYLNIPADHATIPNNDFVSKTILNAIGGLK